MSNVKQLIIIKGDEWGDEELIVLGANASLAFISERLLQQNKEEKGRIVYIEKVDPFNPERTLKVPDASLSVNAKPRPFSAFLTPVELEWFNANAPKSVGRVATEDDLFEAFNRAKAAKLEAYMVQDKSPLCVCIGPDYSNKIDSCFGI